MKCKFFYLLFCDLVILRSSIYFFKILFRISCPVYFSTKSYVYTKKYVISNKGKMNTKFLWQTLIVNSADQHSRSMYVLCIDFIQQF